MTYLFNYPTILAFTTGYGSDTAVLSAKLQNDMTTETGDIDERSYARFEVKMSFGQISYIAQLPKYSVQCALFGFGFITTVIRSVRWVYSYYSCLLCWHRFRDIIVHGLYLLDGNTSCREIVVSQPPGWILNDCISLKFDRCLEATAANGSVIRAIRQL